VILSKKEVMLAKFKNNWFIGLKKKILLLFVTLLLGALGFSIISFSVPLISSKNCKVQNWPLWTTFVNNFISDDGRVIDNNPTFNQTTSEGQSYGLFFALVNNNPLLFDKLWVWTKNNLMRGDENNLPSWSWGQNKSGVFTVLDKNSASDADLWISYSLLEAGRIWKNDSYTLAGLRMLNRIEALEIVNIPSLGPMLLPGQFGFISENPKSWEINPSYLPLFQLRYMDNINPKGDWNQIAINSLKLIKDSSPVGIVPEWVSYQYDEFTKAGFFYVIPSRGTISSYNSIRVYLWAGLTNKKDPLSSELLSLTKGMANIIERKGFPPEEVTVSNGEGDKNSPYGFTAALLPNLTALGSSSLANSLYITAKDNQIKTTKPENKDTNPAFYYDYILSLFGLGHYENRYRFAADGKLELPWLQLRCKFNK